MVPPGLKQQAVMGWSYASEVFCFVRASLSQKPYLSHSACFEVLARQSEKVSKNMKVRKKKLTHAYTHNKYKHTHNHTFHLILWWPGFHGPDGMLWRSPEVAKVFTRNTTKSSKFYIATSTQPHNTNTHLGDSMGQKFCRLVYH